MTALVRYEAARSALQAAHDVDEVKEIRDKAQAMAAYAKQANDTKLVEWATEIKVRAERKAGEMLAEMKVNGSRARPADNLKAGPKSPDVTSGATLDSLGISKNQAARWQKLAAVPESQFEQAVAAAKEVAGEVTTAALLRAAKPTVQERPRPNDRVISGRATEAFGKLQARIKELEEALADSEEKREAAADVARELNDKLEAFETTELDAQQKLIADLQLKLRKRDAEIDRLRMQIRDANNKNNELIRQVKILQRKNGR